MARVSDDIEALIATHIVPHPYRSSLAEARVKGRGVSVWALIESLRLTPGDDAARQVGDAYGITPDAMRAAIEYYKRHQPEIDARLAEIAAFGST